MKQSTNQNGFTLLEVLIAIVVLSIGLLGLVGLQTSALKLNTSAASRSMALDYANSMLNKVRSAPEAEKKGSYSVSSSGARTGDSGSDAYRDTSIWLSNLKKSIPDAQVQSCRTADGKRCTKDKGNYHMVCIKWNQGEESKLFENNSQQVFLLGRI